MGHIVNQEWDRSSEFAEEGKWKLRMSGFFCAVEEEEGV